MNKETRRRFTARVVRAFDAGPAGDGLQVRAASAGNPVEFLIYDYIGSDGWGGGVDPAAVVAALAGAGGAPVTVRINSPGGDVFAGMAIYNALRGYAGDLNTVVDGIAASAASFIALAGKNITMGEQSMMMIHNASTLEWGDKNAMIKTADVLGKIDSQLQAIYAQRTGKPVDEIAAMMDAETYMTGAEAMAGGFCDAVTPAPKKAENVAPGVTAEQAVEIVATSAGADENEIARVRAKIRLRK